ncbi:hypothetical protein KM043_018530 [Ampulex compressa]|nr:hypothetical protein KM043_018530 [Ampulex compressa]
MNGVRMEIFIHVSIASARVREKGPRRQARGPTGSYAVLPSATPAFPPGYPDAFADASCVWVQLPRLLQLRHWGVTNSTLQQSRCHMSSVTPLLNYPVQGDERRFNGFPGRSGEPRMVPG